MHSMEIASSVASGCEGLRNERVRFSGCAGSEVSRRRAYWRMLGGSWVAGSGSDSSGSTTESRASSRAACYPQKEAVFENLDVSPSSHASRS